MATNTFGESTEILDYSSSSGNSAILSSFQPHQEMAGTTYQQTNYPSQFQDSVSYISDSTLKNPMGCSRSFQVAYSVNNVPSLMGGQFFLGYPLSDSDSLNGPQNFFTGLPCSSPLVNIFGPPPLPDVEKRIPRPPPHSVGISLDSPIPQPPSPLKVSTGTPVDLITQFTSRSPLTCSANCLHLVNDFPLVEEPALMRPASNPEFQGITSQPLNDWFDLAENSSIFGYSHLFSSSSHEIGSSDGLRSHPPILTEPPGNSESPDATQNPSMHVVLKMPLSSQEMNIPRPSPTENKKRMRTGRVTRQKLETRKEKRQKELCARKEEREKKLIAQKKRRENAHSARKIINSNALTSSLNSSVKLLPSDNVPLYVRDNYSTSLASTDSTPHADPSNSHSTTSALFNSPSDSKSQENIPAEQLAGKKRSRMSNSNVLQEISTNTASNIIPSPLEKAINPPTKGRRISSGCWTCKLRRKRCDAVRPICGCCKRLGIQCLGYDTKRPEYMTNPKLNQKMRQMISATLRENKSSRG